MDYNCWTYALLSVGTTLNMTEQHLDQPARPVPGLPPRFGRCPETRVIYDSEAHLLDYEQDYFFAEYEKQYGRTYMEDEEALRTLARRRLSRLRAYAKAPARLFEIGCATGFFLDEARKRDYAVSGCELSAFASEKARELGLDVTTGGFLDLEIPDGSLDVIAAFYVLEHIPQQRSLFDRIARLLRPGGVLLFALPSTYGPMFMLRPEEWANSHPADHFADYSPLSLSKTLRLYGIRLQRAWPASYHPARVGRIWALPGVRTLYRISAAASSFGDTFEGIALKEK